MQYLKALVIGLGILILICVGLLAYGLVAKTGFKNSSKPKPSEQSTESFGDIVINNANECDIADIKAEDGTLLLRLGGSSASCQQVVVIEIRSGKVLGKIRLEP